MSEYIVSARKYRPMTFSSVIGQSSIATTLKNAIQSGKLAHAYLFCGPRGVGKTTCARIFAKTINCLQPREDGEACNECESCLSFNEQRSLNIHELDAASNNSVDDIRNLIEQVRIPPQIGKYKVFIIDEVHMLSTSAFNAFLKTLEEPPAHAIFILATTEKHKILPTILSRCQIYDFQRMTIENTIQHLAHVAEQEGYTYESAALNVIAQKADGGMRDALSIFDQVVSYTGGNITYQHVIENLNVLDYDYYFRLVDLLLEKKISESLLLFNEILSKGFEGGPFISGLASHLRDLLVSRDPQTTQLLEASEDIRRRYAEQAQRCRPQWLYRAIRLCNDCDQAYRTSRNKRLQVELTLIEAAQATDDDASAGRRPARILKPIFDRLATAAAAKTVIVSTPAQQVTTTPTNAPQHPNEETPAPLTEAELPQPPAQPQQPPQTPARPAATTPASKLRKLSIDALSPSIGRSHVGKKATKDTEQSESLTTTEPTENQPVTQETIILQWQSFINTLSVKETALAQNMKIMQPQLASDQTTVDILLDNKDIHAMLQPILPQLQQYLRTSLHNSLITLNCQIVEKATTVVRSYDKRELLKRFCSSNPSLITLGKTFKLELT